MSPLNMLNVDHSPLNFLSQSISIHTVMSESHVLVKTKAPRREEERKREKKTDKFRVKCVW